MLRQHDLAEFVAVAAEPFGLAEDHFEEVQARVMAEEAGGGNRQDRFGEHGFNHQVHQAVTLALTEPDDLAVAVQELEDAVAVEVSRPLGRVRPVRHYRELEHAIGQVRGRRRDADGVKIHHGYDLLA